MPLWQPNKIAQGKKMTDPQTALFIGITLIPVLIVIDFVVGYITGTGVRARLTRNLEKMMYNHD